MLNKFLKICGKMISGDVKANKNISRNKRYSGCILQIFIRSTFKT